MATVYDLKPAFQNLLRPTARALDDHRAFISELVHRFEIHQPDYTYSPAVDHE